jgi:flavodoxin
MLSMPIRCSHWGDNQLLNRSTMKDGSKFDPSLSGNALQSPIYIPAKEGRNMNVLIIYMSYHRMNTEKVAKAMAGVMEAALKKVIEVGPEDLLEYDLIGFGSGIYGGRPHKTLLMLVDRIPRMEKDAFIFSTAGNPQKKHHQPLKDLLVGKGFSIVGEFQCRGVFGPMWFSLVNRGHPDEQELEQARAFAQGLIPG